jgi:hypothetical protein
MIAWKVAVTHLTLDDGDLDFSDCGWVGLSDDTQTELIPGGKLSIDDHAIGDLPDEIAVVLVSWGISSDRISRQSHVDRSGGCDDLLPKKARDNALPRNEASSEFHDRLASRWRALRSRSNAGAYPGQR